MPKRTGVSDSLRSEPPASSDQWRSRMGPLRSSSAESVAATTASKVSSATPQSRRLCGTPWPPSGTLILPQPGAAQPALDALHLAVVGLVVVAPAVEDAVQQQGLDLPLDAVTGLCGLAARRGHGDQDVPHVSVLAGKGEDVGALVLAAEIPIHPARLAVAAKAHAQALAARRHGRQQAGEPGAQPAGADFRVTIGVLQDELDRCAQFANHYEACRMALFSRFGAALKSK